MISLFASIIYFLFRLLVVLIACSTILSWVLQDPGMIPVYGGNQK